MTNPYLQLDREAFRQGAGGTIPRGYLWNASPNTTQGKVWSGIAASVADLHARAGDLSERESDPSRAVETLPDWERAYGLPDPCTPLNPTIAQRQAALVSRIASQGGQSIAYYVAVAAALGWQISITEFHPFRANVSHAGDRAAGQAWAFAWLVNVPSVAVRWFSAGIGAGGEPLWTIDDDEIACRLRAVAPAHTVLLFHFGP